MVKEKEKGELKLLREEEHQKRRVKRAKHADGSPRIPRARSRTSIEPRAKNVSNASPTEWNAIHQQLVLCNSKTCGPPNAHMAPAHVEHGNNTDHAEEGEENRPTRNSPLEALTMPRASPVMQQSLQGREVCRVAVSCPFALDIMYLSTEW